MPLERIVLQLVARSPLVDSFGGIKKITSVTDGEIWDSGLESVQRYMEMWHNKE